MKRKITKEEFKILRNGRKFAREQNERISIERKKYNDIFIPLKKR